MFDPARLVFIDETCTTTRMVRPLSAHDSLSSLPRPRVVTELDSRGFGEMKFFSRCPVNHFRCFSTKERQVSFLKHID